MTDTRRLSDPLTSPMTVAQGALQTQKPLVTVVQWAYRVDYGLGVRPQLHSVSKLRRCHCALGADCPAVVVVGDYLKAGGERAADPPIDFWPWVPNPCPICGGATEPQPGLNSPRHGLGWRCTLSGGWCYWAARTLPLMAAVALRGEPVATTHNVEPSAEMLEKTLARMRSWLPVSK
jgi:hypothetical protein